MAYGLQGAGTLLHNCTGTFYTNISDKFNIDLALTSTNLGKTWFVTQECVIINQLWWGAQIGGPLL